MKLPRIRSMVAATLLVLVTCAARRPAMSPPELVREAEALGTSDRMGAISALEDYLASQPNAQAVPWAMVWAGEQRRLAGDLPVARTWFETVADRYPSHPMREASQLGMALVDAERSLSGNQLATLQLVSPRNLPNSMNADRYRILARVAADEGTPSTKTRDLVRKAVAFSAGDPSVEGRVRATLADLLSARETTSLAEVDPGGASPAQVAVMRAKGALNAGDFTEAAEQAGRVASTWPDSEWARTAQYIVKRANAGDPTIPGKVGIMLPESGQYAPVGKRLRQVIELANEQAGGPLEFVFVDTGAAETDITKLVEDLALSQGCVAVLGPLLKEHVMSAAETAQAIGLPLVALSKSHKPTQVGEYVFRGFLPLEQQVQALADHAVDVEGHRKIGILAPDTAYGQAARDLFIEAVTRKGAEIVHAIDYDATIGDFRGAARTLGGKDDPDYLAELTARRAEAGLGPLNPKKIPPRIEVEAVFIPDNHKRVVLVASALAYEEFPVGSFTPVGGGGIQLLGLNGWHSPELARTGGQYVDGSIFVDAYFASAGADSQAFAMDYHQAFSRPPNVIDALTWDTIRMLSIAVVQGGSSREQIRDELNAVELPDPVAGGGQFADNREVQRSLQILTVHRNRGIEQWTTPEDKLPPQGIEPTESQQTDPGSTP